MAPSTMETVQLPQPIREKVITKATRVRQPLNLSGALDAYQSFDVTPVIGREFPEVQLTSLLSAYNSHELLRDLAITSELIVFWCKKSTGSNNRASEQFLSAGSFSSAIRISRYKNKRSLVLNSVSLLENRQLRNYTYIVSNPSMPQSED